MASTSERLSVHQLSSHGWLLWAGFGGCAYYGLARLGTSLFSLQPSNFTILWLPIGVGVILVDSLGWRALPVVTAAVFASSWDAMADAGGLGPWVHVGLAALADTLMAALVVLGLRRLLARSLQSVADLTRLVLYVALPAIALCVLLLCLNLYWAGLLTAHQAGLLFGKIVAADTLGLLLLVPGWLYWCDGQRLKIRELPVLLGSLVLMALLLELSFQSTPAAIYLVTFLLMVIALRGSPLLLQALLLPTSIAVVAMASRVGLGPFAIGDRSAAVQMLITFLLSMALLSIGASLQRSELQRQFEAGQHWLRQANIDPLTGLANRRAFDATLNQELQRFRRQGNPISVALIDIDNFKRINDQFGHACGDLVLKAMAHLMHAELRDFDVVARYGGEEFALLLSGCDRSEAERSVQRLRQRLELLRPEGLHVTVSAGLAEAALDDTPSALLARADTLLYAAKDAGRNCIRVG